MSFKLIQSTVIFLVISTTLVKDTSCVSDNLSDGPIDKTTSIKNITTRTEECNCRKGICERNKSGKLICICKPGYGLYDDMKCRKVCRKNKDCYNNGMCRFEGNGYFCSCRDPFFGDFCERKQICMATNECFKMGAVCQYIERLEKGFCVCPYSQIFNTQTQMCEDICSPEYCFHGKCEAKNKQRKCRCDEGYVGSRCEHIQSGKPRYAFWFGIFCSGFSILFAFFVSCKYIQRWINKTSSENANVKAVSTIM